VTNRLYEETATALFGMSIIACIFKIISIFRKVLLYYSATHVIFAVAMLTLVITLVFQRMTNE